MAVTEAAGGVDASGNYCVVSCQPEQNNGSLIDVVFTKYDISGNAAVNKRVLTVNGTVYKPQIIISPPIEGVQFAYLLINANDTNAGLTAFVYKVDLSGNIRWSDSRLPTAMGETVGTAGGYADGAGNFYAAYALSYIGFAPLLEFVTYGGGGATQHDVTATKTAGDAALSFAAGKWVAVGYTDMFDLVPKFATFDPTTANQTCDIEFPSVDNGVYTYSYGLDGYTHPNGTEYLGVTVYKTKDGSGGLPVLVNHFIRSYSLTGALHWVSASYPGYLYQITGDGATNCPLWVTAAPNASTAVSLERFESTGTQTFVKSGYSSYHFSPPLADANQTFQFFVDTSYHRRLNIDQFDSSGNPGTVISSTTALGSSTDYSLVQDMFLFNGNLYTTELLPYGQQVAFQRFVSGVTLSAISTSQTVGANAMIQVKVQLNSPAPTGGMLVKMTSNNANLLFPNNLTSYSLAIPAGSIYTNVSMHTGTVTTASTVTVTANQNGVVRLAAVVVHS
jgi:hypothetical protein